MLPLVHKEFFNILLWKNVWMWESLVLLTEHLFDIFLSIFMADKIWIEDFNACRTGWWHSKGAWAAQNPLSKKSKNIEKWRIFICYPLSKKLKIIQKWRFFICYPYQYAAPYQKRKKESSKKWRIFICYPPSKIPKWSIFLARAKSEIWNFVLFSVLIEKS